MLSQFLKNSIPTSQKLGRRSTAMNEEIRTQSLAKQRRSRPKQHTRNRGLFWSRRGELLRWIRYWGKERRMKSMNTKALRAVVRTDLTGQEMLRSQFIPSIENVRERH
jgi:hypothetical protein